MRRVDRLRKECRDGEGLERMAEMLYAMANDPAVREADRVAAAREWRQVVRDLGNQPAKTGSVKDELASRRNERRRANG